jgi:hypothetical protein
MSVLLAGTSACPLFEYRTDKDERDRQECLSYNRWEEPWMDSLLRDLKFSARSLVKEPGFAAIAVLTLELGIAANTTIYSAVDALILHPFSFPTSGCSSATQR